MLDTLKVLHDCPGPDCLHCKMLRYGYVRSATVGMWWRPAQPCDPWMSDEQAKAWPLQQVALL